DVPRGIEVVPDDLGRAGAGAAALGAFSTVIRALLASSIVAPAAERAVSLTRISTTASYGRSPAGRKTRSVLFSANPTVPLMGRPFTVTTNAAFVVRCSMGSVKRTESVAFRWTFAVSALGRNRTTAGAAVVLTVMAAVSATGAPVSSSSGPR